MSVVELSCLWIRVPKTGFRTTAGLLGPRVCLFGGGTFEMLYVVREIRVCGERIGIDVGVFPVLDKGDKCRSLVSFASVSFLSAFSSVSGSVG